VAWQLATGVAVVIIIAHTGEVIDSKMTPALFLPVVGVATAAVEGGTITNKAVYMSTRLAIPQLVVSYFLLGIALFLAMMFYLIFLHRLMATGWLKPAAIAGLAILIGTSTFSPILD
jgi:tellurite resistance protein TehA-like permease